MIENTAMKSRIYDILIGIVVIAIISVVTWSYLRARPAEKIAEPALVAVPQPTRTAQPSSTPVSSLALTIQPDGLTIENRTNGPLEQCVVQILGGWAALVPVIPAHASEFRFFTMLFGSEDHEFQAHVAGKQFGAFAYANATAKTTVACRDINGRRVVTVFSN